LTFVAAYFRFEVFTTAWFIHPEDALSTVVLETVREQVYRRQIRVAANGNFESLTQPSARAVEVLQSNAFIVLDA